MHAITSSSGEVKEYQDKRRVTVVGAVVNLVLAIAKVVFGTIGQSQALIADGIHSFSDLVSDAMVLYAAKHNSRGPDEDHPYGHARFETAATVGLGLMLMFVAIGIIMDATERMFDPDALLNPGWLALAVAIVSILSKEYLYHYTMIVARRLRSNMLRANAWHHRSDAVSSIVVVVGIAGTMAGLPYLDSVAAVLVGLMIAKIGWELGWNSLRELVDTALKPEELTEIRETILSVAGVKSMHKLRTRRMGGKGLINVHIVVDPKVTVSEGHQISENVRNRLKDEVVDILDVTVHIDPEDDSEQKPTQGLPGREEMLKRLNKLWSSLDSFHRIERINLHYLEGKVDVELLLPMSVMQDKEHAQQIADGYSQQGKSQEGVGEVKVCFH
jgi:cation diffusion facilitator family transporter